MLDMILPEITCPYCKKLFKPRRINQKYCSVECRENSYKETRKEYYNKNKEKIKQQQKKYREKRKMKKLEELFNQNTYPKFLCKMKTKTIKLNDPIKNYHYNESYDLWTITTLQGDTYFIYGENIRELKIYEITHNNQEKLVVKCKKGKILDIGD